MAHRDRDWQAVAERTRAEGEALLRKWALERELRGEPHGTDQAR